MTMHDRNRIAHPVKSNSPMGFDTPNEAEPGNKLVTRKYYQNPTSAGQHHNDGRRGVPTSKVLKRCMTDARITARMAAS